MKSFIFVSLLLSFATVVWADSGRFDIDSERLVVSYFGKAQKADDVATYAGVEKEAWSDAVRYLYQNISLLSGKIDFSASEDAPVVPELVRRLRSKNTIYHRDGSVKVLVEFSYKGYESHDNDPFAAYKKSPDKM